MQIFITRHGRTPDNIAELQSGQNGTLMDEVGCDQISRLGMRLQGISPQRVFASDQPRVRQCMEILSQFITVPVEYCTELRERNFGELDRKDFPTYLAALKASGTSPLEFRPIGGESYQDVIARVSVLIRRLDEMCDCDRLGIVAHGNLNRTLISLLTRRDIKEIRQDPANLTILSKDASGCEILLLNDVSHLRDNKSRAPQSAVE